MGINQRRPLGGNVLKAILWAFCVAASPAGAAIINVTEFADDDPTINNGSCSLREAVTAANTDAAVDSCVSGSGDDVVSLPDGTYTLSRAGVSENGNSTGDLDFTSNLTIVGSSASAVTIDANQIDRVMQIASSNISVTLQSVTVTGGRPPVGEGGGAVSMGDIGSSLQQSTLTVIESVLSGNSTQGSADDGGAIVSKRIGAPDCQDCSVVIMGSTLSGNVSADRGGAITNNGNQLTITNSTISGNQSVDDGGGIESTGSFNSFVCNNCTIANNSSGADGGGGGVDLGSTSTKILHNTIIADNTSIIADSADCEGTGAVTVNFSLIETPAGCTALMGNSNLFNMDPALGSLGDNGGPGTPTMALTMGSVAIDAGETNGAACQDNAGGTITMDQRRALRASGMGLGGAACDMGAYEFDSPGTPVELLEFTIH